MISAEASFKTLDELIAYGKSKPEGLTFASPGVGSQPSLAAELLFRDAGVKGLNIPFRGDSMAYTELLAGRVDATLTAISTALPYVQSGKFRVLGVASAERSAIYPQAPTLREQAIPTSSPPAGTASWRRQRRRNRSSTGSKASSAAFSVRQRSSRSCSRRASTSASTRPRPLAASLPPRPANGAP
jgi:hypothetical protein